MEIIEIIPCSGWWVIVQNAPMKFPRDGLYFDEAPIRGTSEGNSIVRAVASQLLAAWSKCRDSEGNTCVMGMVPTIRGTLEPVWDVYEHAYRNMQKEEVDPPQPRDFTDEVMFTLGVYHSVLFHYTTSAPPACAKCDTRSWLLDYGELGRHYAKSNKGGLLKIYDYDLALCARCKKKAELPPWFKNLLSPVSITHAQWEKWLSEREEEESV